MPCYLTVRELPLKNQRPGYGWVMSIILASWEAEIKRITVQDHPGKRIHYTPSKPIAGCSDVCLSSQLHRQLRFGESQFQDSPSKKVLNYTNSREKSCKPIHPSDAGSLKQENLSPG
jgi:hypothetical protein